MSDMPPQQAPGTPERSYDMYHRSPFVFQDTASSQDELSEYQAGSEASASVRRMLSPRESSRQIDHQSVTSSTQSGSSAPSAIHTRRYIPYNAPPPTYNNNSRASPLHNRTNTMPPARRQQTLNHVPYTPGDVSSITSNSMTSGAFSSSESSSSYASSSAASKSAMHSSNSRRKSYLNKGKSKRQYRPLRNDGSDTELSSESSSGGFLRGLLRPPKNRCNNEQSSNNQDDDETSPSWALSPSISSIPEEHDSHSIQSSQPDVEMMTGSPPQSQKSMNSSAMDANNSLAMSSSVVSEFGYHSEETTVIRNTTEQQGHGSSSDIERGRGGRPPLPTIPSNGSNDKPKSLEESSSSSTEEFAQHRKRPFFCSARQGVVICCLLLLFIFGVITVIVSFVLSQREDDNNKTAGMIQSDVQGQDDDIFNNNFTDDMFPDTSSTTATAFSNDDPALVPTVAPTEIEDVVITEEPTVNFPNSGGDDTLFADALEELLNSVGPSASPTIQPAAPTRLPATSTTIAPSGSTPTSTPTEVFVPEQVAVSSNTEVPTSAPVLETAAPTTNPTGVPTLRPTSTPTSSPSASPTTAPTLSPSTSAPSQTPTTLQPLLGPETILSEEAQFQGSAPGDTAGYSIALSGNGQVLVVGAPNAAAGTSGLSRAGQVQIYERQPLSTVSATARQNDNDASHEWSLRGTSLIEGFESMNQLGYAVATNDVGNVVVISEPTAERRRGRVHVYEWEDAIGEYVQRQTLQGSQPTDHFGISLSLSGDGRRLAVGAPYYSTQATGGSPATNLRGQVRVYEYSETTQQWEVMEAGPPNLLQGSASLDWFGWSVALSYDGQVLSVGAPRNTEFGGYVQCFQSGNGGTWQLLGSPIINLIAPVKLDDRFGHSVSVTSSNGARASADVKRVAIGSPGKDVGEVLNSGLAVVYEWSESEKSWLLDNNGALGGVLKEEEPGVYHQFGYSLEMVGNTLAVGVPGWDDRRGLVNIFWLGDAFTENSAESDTWKSLNEPIVGSQKGDDFGFSVSFTFPDVEDSIRPSRPSSLLLASGAIMVSNSSAPDSAGYARVYHTGK